MAFSGKNQTNPQVISATGYAPYVKARADRANKKEGGGSSTMANRQAQAIRDYWVKQDFAQGFSDYTDRHVKDLLRNKWEFTADRKALYSRVQWEMDKVQATLDEDLERRRDRLSELLRAEEEMYIQEMIPEQEDVESKSARMLSRYKELKTQKEMERQKLVDEKRDQQFKRNCDELRSKVSRMLHQEAALEGRQLISEKRRESEAQNREAEDVYSDMWRRDAEAKRRREEKEVEDRRRKDKENEKCVTDQMAERKMQRRKQLLQKEEDAEIMAEQRRLLDLEEEWSKETKRRKQATTKQDLDECLRFKLRLKAKEVQDDLMQDLFFLKQIIEDQDESAKDEKKRRLMHEQQEYLKYLKDQAMKEQDFEQELDRMCQEELEKMWSRRQEDWDEERKKRKKMEQDVMKGVKEQIMDNMEKDRRAQRLNREYAQKVIQEDEDDRRRELEKLRLIREKNAQHQQELVNQIRTKEEKLEQERRLQEREMEALRKARVEEEAKIRKLLSEMNIDCEHPYRACRREDFDDCADWES